MECNHTSKVLEWSYDLVDGDVNQIVSKYGCVDCDVTSDKPFKSEWYSNPDHSNCEENPCFGCKAQGLTLSTGEATTRGWQSAKKHDKELGSYYDALRQGIEPVSTKQKDIDAAVRLSNDTGTAFDGNAI
jgi:hypothetical protein